MAGTLNPAAVGLAWREACWFEMESDGVGGCGWPTQTFTVGPPVPPAPPFLSVSHRGSQCGVSGPGFFPRRVFQGSLCWRVCRAVSLCVVGARVLGVCLLPTQRWWASGLLQLRAFGDEAAVNAGARVSVGACLRLPW